MKIITWNFNPILPPNKCNKWLKFQVDRLIVYLGGKVVIFRPSVECAVRVVGEQFANRRFCESIRARWVHEADANGFILARYLL